MKVGLLSPPHQQEAGGGYTYVTMVHNALERMDLGVECTVLDFREIEYTPQSEIPESEVVDARLVKDVNVPVNRALNHVLKTRGIDFLWMVTPSTILVPCIPFMVTVWDLAHRYFPFFPEVSTSGWTWGEREAYYRTVLPRASYVLTGTERGADEIMRCYGIPRERLRIVPLPAPRMGTVAAVPRAIPRRYLFYPAQFWPHKNHVRAIRALRLLRQDPAFDLDLVLVGADHGSQDHIRALIAAEGLQDHVHLLGFVERPLLEQLYRDAEALLYLSFFGPDNLPPLEALGCGCPVVVSDHPGHREQLAGSAVFVDPLDEHAIAEGVKRVCRDGVLREQLIAAGLALVAGRHIETYLSQIRKVFAEFAAYHACWPLPSTLGKAAPAAP